MESKNTSEVTSQTSILPNLRTRSQPHSSINSPKSSQIVYYDDPWESSKPGGHHRPRIKLKSDFVSPPIKKSIRHHNTNSTITNHFCYKTKLLRPLTPELIITIALVTLVVTLVSICTTARLPGACASSINPLNSSAPDELLKDSKDSNTPPVASSASTQTSDSESDFHLLNQLISVLNQEKLQQTTIADRNKNNNNNLDRASYNKDIDKLPSSISDSSYDTKSHLTRTEKDIMGAATVQVQPTEANYLRPLPHFTNDLSANDLEKTETHTPEVCTGGSETADMQADQPPPYLDNNAETEPTVPSRIAKSSKTKSQSQLNDLHTGRYVDTLQTATTTPFPSPYSLPSSTNLSSSPTTSNNNRIVSLAKSTKPRRLETLSYGIKSRIPNSINFEDEEYEEASSASVSNVVINANPGQQQQFQHQQQGILHGQSQRLRNNSFSNHDSTGGSRAPNNPFRRSPLQIRRDLSRLVAANAGVGNEIDDDIGSLSSKCDRLFISTPNGPRNGTFESPTLEQEEVSHLYQCILMFVARPNERVEITFHEFKVRGTPPECVHEWVDIWTEVEGTDPTDLITTPFSGRYCGKIPPRRRISLYGGIAVGFYSDKSVTNETIFYGTYNFINETRYIVGTPVPRTICSYTILASSNKGIGELLSPTYPGVYPKNLSCSYKFIGSPGQRIRIEFRDFDIFYGGAHCPFDDVKVYDGTEPTSPLIGTYCGQQRNLVIYSSEHNMFVTFTTLDRNTDSQNRGFNAVYEFSNSFVKLDFIEKNLGDHIRGTECDQRILSKSLSTGVIYSPNYPFPYLPKIVCRYFIYGMQDPQNLERIKLSFEIFDVPSNTNSAEDEINQSDAKRCGDGFLKVYLKGQEIIQAFDKADFEFCGKEIPHTVVSDGPRLVLVFSSGETQGSGFKARYTFETEYRVPGTASPDGACHFTYYSTSRKKGEFNSPRFPSNYPSGTNCTYLFYVQNPEEQVRIVFDNFKLKANVSADKGAYGSMCEEDWLEIWNVMASQDDRLVGRYCSTTAPGPIESREKAVALKVIMHTDDEGVYSGFKARYVYFTAKTLFGDCGENISQANSGVLTSPKWPDKYDGPSKGEGSSTCNWYLTVRPGSRVMFHIQSFETEGEPIGRGCPAAAVRIWEDPEDVPVELCGEKLPAENSQYVSSRNTMRITFITADKAVGAPGFYAVWTEVQDGASGVPCHHTYFRCAKTQFCIPADLKCDGTRNCGTGNGELDTSDEDDCGLEFGDMNLVFSVGVGIAVSLLLIIVLCAWGQRRKRRRRRRLQLRRPPIHVCDNAGARFAAMDSV